MALAFLGVYAAFAVIYAFLSPSARAGLVAWASTNLQNLHHDPVGCLVVSAFVPQELPLVWIATGSLGLFTVNRLLGNVRAAILLAAGHVVGSLVSEGIVGYQISTGALPPTARAIPDVGPSYVIVCALVAATLYGSRIQQVAAGAGFAVLATDIFGGITHLQVTAVGHVTATVTGALLGGALLWGARRARGEIKPAVAGQAHVDHSPAGPQVFETNPVD